MAQAADQLPTGLYWKGKTSEVPRVSLPFQTVETIDSSHTKSSSNGKFSHTKHEACWHNRLIWGENKYIMSSLLAEFAGKIDLIYIYPPFATGADFSLKIDVGDYHLTKEPSIIEEKAYRDTWGKGLDSYLQMMYERLLLMRDLLSDEGSIYVHCDWRVNSFTRLILDEIFSDKCYQSEVVLKRRHAHSDARIMGNVHDTIFLYSKSEKVSWNPQYTEYSQEYVETYYRYKDPDGRRWLSRSTTAPGGRGPVYEWNGIQRAWRYRKEEMRRLHDSGRIYYTQKGMPRYKQYLDEMPGVPAHDLMVRYQVYRFVGRRSPQLPNSKTRGPVTAHYKILLKRRRFSG